MSADARHGEHGVCEGVGWRLAVLRCECLEKLDFEFGEEDLRRKIGLFTTEERHQVDTPGDDEVDGDGADKSVC